MKDITIHPLLPLTALDMYAQTCIKRLTNSTTYKSCQSSTLANALILTHTHTHKILLTIFWSTIVSGQHPIKGFQVNL